MSGLTLVEEGDNIPIVLQISDGNIGVFPQAVITDDSGVVLGTVSLTHVANGLYQTTFIMTNDTYINSTYIVYTDALHTIESTTYQRDIDTFLLTSIQAKLQDLHDENFGKWIIDHNANTLTLYRKNGIDILKIFNLGLTTDDVPCYISRTPV